MLHVLGSINLDMIANVSHLPLKGETIGAKDFATAPGGKGANQALSAARAGAEVKLFGAVGNDGFDKQALAELRLAKIIIDGVKKLNTATGIALIMVDAKGENVIVIVPGANAGVDEAMAYDCVKTLGKTDYLVLVQEIPFPTLSAALEQAKSKGVTSILNIAPAIEQTKKLALLADIIIANQTEFSVLLGENLQANKIEQLGQQWAFDNNKTLIITLGEKGAIAFTKNQTIKVEAPKIIPVDSVGAGDTFCGYLAAGLDQGMDLKSSLQRAVIAGSLACLKPTAQKAIPYASEVNSWFGAGPNA